MLRIPARSRQFCLNLRMKSTTSSSFIRSTFIDYFMQQHGHKHVKSSPVVPLCDPTVPFVNAGMNQFKGVFLGTVDAPCPRAVNSQKCVRVGGKHNDLDVVGTDGYHHTFFEMLGNWSFGDYYKKEACQMAWDLLLGPYRLKPENLVVTYFSGDEVIGLPEDRECRDIWRHIGVPESRLKGLGAKDNFWEMGASGPCGPCTEVHHVNTDGSLTEIWNLVFIQCNREADGKVRGLRRQHVDTGMGLERVAALMQGAPSNYDTDLFKPIIQAIHKNSKGVRAYNGAYEGPDAKLDAAYRRLADHARMISVCLADGVFPATSLNLKQIMRKSFQISADVFQNPRMLETLYDEVVNTLGPTYPELVTRSKDAKVVLEHEEQAFAKMRRNLTKKWRELERKYPEVEALADVETAGLALGYTELKEAMSKRNSTVIPGELVFKLYDTHGLQSDVIERIATLNNLKIDKEGFSKLRSEHKSRHKTAFKEQTSNRGLLFDAAVEKIIQNGVKSTNDQHKYNYDVVEKEVIFKPLKTKLAAILNRDCEWVDFLEPCEDRPYYLVTEDSNFYCEEGGQVADTGTIIFNRRVTFKVENVFKIRDFVFHKGVFSLDKSNSNYVNLNSDVVLEIDGNRRLNIMRNHTAVHLLNAAIRKVLPNSVVCQNGSSVTQQGLSLSLSVYGEKLSQKVILDAQELIRESIKSNVPVTTRVVDALTMSREGDVVTVPGETYPEIGLRMVTLPLPLVSKELCCGTHVPCTGFLQDVCIPSVRAAGGSAPTVYALTGPTALAVRELFCRARKLHQVIDLIEPDRLREEVAAIKKGLSEICPGGAPYGEYAECLAQLDRMLRQPVSANDVALQAVADAEVREAFSCAFGEGRRFVVHFVRCSYLMRESALARALAAVPAHAPALLLGCAGGHVLAAARLPQESVSESFTAERWLRCVAPVFQAEVTVPEGRQPQLYAEMAATKVSLINCEQLVQDAMRVAIKYAQAQLKDAPIDQHNRQQN